LRRPLDFTQYTSIGVEHHPSNVAAAGPDRFGEGITNQLGAHM
jgi:hypothetical protein